MKRFVKIILIILVVFLALIGLLVTCTGLAIKKGVEAVAEKAMDSGPQNEVITSDGVIITKALTAKPVLLFQGLEMCTPPNNTSPLTYSYSSNCFNGTCTTTIDVDKNKPFPKDLALYRKYNGTCMQQTIPDVAKYQVNQYKGEVSIGPTLAQQLLLYSESNPKVQKTAKSKFNGNSMVRFNGNTAITIEYGTAKPQEDEFLFGPKLIQIKYSN